MFEVRKCQCGRPFMPAWEGDEECELCVAEKDQDGYMQLMQMEHERQELADDQWAKWCDEQEKHMEEDSN